ncbi:proteasome subunit beta type-1 [Podospora conica]|nr:proteasome subunit beta type-1 [Schizothecium conicum]
MARRQHITLMAVAAIFVFMTMTYFLSGGHSSDSESKLDLNLSDSLLNGGSIAPKLGNATAKAELGRASWKLIHTTMARFPDKPTDDERLALKTFIQLFARLYPCGECASHFQKIIKKYPPQTSTRSAAAGWACEMHNIVNTRLHKPLFDCSKIGDFYDCGCGDEDGKGKKGEGEGAKAKGEDDLKGRESLKVETEEGLQPRTWSSALRATWATVSDAAKDAQPSTTEQPLTRHPDGIHVDMDRLKKGEVNMAVTFKDGVILAADSRTTTGAYIANRVTDKLTRVHDTIWCCRSGSAADTQAVADIVQYHLGLYAMTNGQPPTTQIAASIFQEICYANKDNLSAGLIIAGWDERHGGQVYAIPLGGSLHKQPYSIGGSGSTYIYGFCDANWKEGMNEEEAVAFVKGALREAIKWDGSSGGVIRMVVLTAKGADRHLYLPDTDYKVRHM